MDQINISKVVYSTINNGLLNTDEDYRSPLFFTGPIISTSMCFLHKKWKDAIKKQKKTAFRNRIPTERQ